MTIIDDLFKTQPPHDGLPADAPRGKEAANILAGELLYELRSINATLTEKVAQLAGQITNNVLYVGTLIFDATTFKQLGPFHVAAGSIVVDNLAAANIVTVTSHAPSPDGVAPASGTGVYKVKGGQCRAINVASHNITVYGTNADSVSVQVLTAAARPVASA